MPERFLNQEYYKIFLTFILFTILIVPMVWMILSGKSRAWLKSGIEGENQKLDLNEIWEIIYMWMSIGSFIVLVYMIVNYTHNGVMYSWEQYSLMFFGTAGSNGIAAWIIYLKQKNAKWHSVTDLLIGFLLGVCTTLLAFNWAMKKYIRNKLALRKIISEMYHKDLLPEICRAEGLVDLATRENHHQYAKLALSEIRKHKEKVIAIIKKYEPYQWKKDHN